MLLFVYLVCGGTIYHALNHSEGVAKLSELGLQLNVVVFTRISTLMSLFQYDHILPSMLWMSTTLFCRLLFRSSQPVHSAS